MIPTEDCESVLPLLFATLEGGVTPAEEGRITGHLAGCPPCRAALEEERRLSRWLGASAPAPRRGVLARRGMRIAAAAVVLVALLSLPGRSSTAYGSITEGRLDATVSWRTAAPRPLQESNRVALDAGIKATLEIEGVGTLRATGPAVFEVDRTDRGWKLTLLEGGVRIELDDGARLRISSVHGSRVLTGGSHDVTLDRASFVAGSAPASRATLLQRALAAFSAAGGARPGAMVESERRLRAVLADEATPEKDRETASFYLWCALHNQGRSMEALRESARWLARYRNPVLREYTLKARVGGFLAMGDRAGARAALEALLREFPEASGLADLRRLLGAREDAPAPAGSDPPPERGPEGAQGAPPPGPSDYLVVATALDAGRADHARFRAVAERAARFHAGGLVSWDGGSTAALEERLRQHLPENVLFVLPPEALDVNLHHRILLLCRRLDDDPFVDTAFGYLTARDGAALTRLWERTETLHREGLSSRRWMETAVTSGRGPSWYSAGAIPGIARAAGFEGGQYYFVSREKDPEVLDFVDRHLKDLESASVLSLSGNGDPQGIWLFDARRNLDRSLHWEFDPAKVGRDPEGVMPRIRSDRFRKLALAGPILWSGTCHSGATHRVFVEGDIVSTFGRAERVALYRLPADESLALAWIDAGATALLVPIAANHGLVITREQEFALREGATLGDAVRSTWNDVMLQAGGRLRLPPEEEGAAPHRGDPIMQVGGSNRILIGDPALRPFAKTAPPAETVEVRTAPEGSEVEVRLAKGFHPFGWDMFGTDRARDWRVYVRIPLADPRLAPDPAAVTVRIDDGDGAPVPAVLRHAVVERDHGRTWLHLQANGPRDRMSYRALRAVFRWPGR